MVWCPRSTQVQVNPDNISRLDSIQHQTEVLQLDWKLISDSCRPKVLSSPQYLQTCLRIFVRVRIYGDATNQPRSEQLKQYRTAQIRCYVQDDSVTKLWTISYLCNGPVLEGWWWWWSAFKCWWIWARLGEESFTTPCLISRTLTSPSPRLPSNFCRPSYVSVPLLPYSRKRRCR